MKSKTFFAGISDFWQKNKDKPLFKGKMLAVIVLIIAVILNFSAGDADKNEGNNAASETSAVQNNDEEDEQDNEETPKKTDREIHIGTSNIIALGLGIAAFAVVKIKQEASLNGKHNKPEE